jgi:hypothetical protein
MIVVSIYDRERKYGVVAVAFLSSVWMRNWPGMFVSSKRTDAVRIVIVMDGAPSVVVGITGRGIGIVGSARLVRSSM